jgi:hypothetical protein
MASKNNPLVAELFQPFLDNLKQFTLVDIMYVTWGLVGNLQFDKPIPTDIQTRREYDPNLDLMKRRVAGVNEWELEFILSQALLYSPQHVLTVHSAKQWKYFGALVKELRTFEDKVHKILFETDESLIFKEFFRTAHRQFPWQMPMTKQSTYRYFKIFNDEQMRPIVEKVVGLTTLEIYRIGLTFMGLFNNSFSATMPLQSSVTVIDEKKVGLFIYTFGSYVDTIRSKISEASQLDESMVYGYSPIRAHPILILKDNLYCPLPTLLLWQITSGVYYLLINDPSFKEAFGNAFQNYVGFVLREVLGLNRNFSVYPEAMFGKPRKRTIDWIVEDKDAYLMIECKSKRLTVSSKSRVLDTTAIESDLDKMTSFIIQGYKTITDFKASRYPQVQYDNTKKIYLVVLTLEEWFINFNHQYSDQLKGKVIDGIRRDQIDENLVTEVPYLVESMETFERNIQLIESIGIASYADLLTRNELVGALEKLEQRDLSLKYFDSEILGFMNR